MKPDDIDTLLFCSMRYAYGRFTYIVADVCRIVREQYAHCSDSDQLNLLRDLDTELRRAESRKETLGGDDNHARWVALRDWMASHGSVPTAGPGASGSSRG